MTSPRVTLTVLRGELQGQRFVFDNPAHFTMGRAADCDIQLAARYGNSDVSRHHCLLDIQPPMVHVRDLGSRNGTYVNNLKIGQRLQHEPPDESDTDGYPQYELHNGDELRVGDVVFLVDIDETTSDYLEPIHVCESHR